MKVCVNCFSDKELKGFISSSTEIGDCEVCESKNQPLLDASELFDFFQEMLDNYKVFENGMPLASKIQSHWSFLVRTVLPTRFLMMFYQTYRLK